MEPPRSSDPTPVMVEEEGRRRAPSVSAGSVRVNNDMNEPETAHDLDDDDKSDDDEHQSYIIGNVLPPPLMPLPNYYDWRTTYPQLQLLLDNIEVLKAEAKTVHTWIPWPEDHYSKADGSKADWTVFPFLHTFPASDSSKMTWIGSTNAHCPRSSALLRQVDGLRTALFSRLGPKTKLSLHTGWDDLANHVLRCHVNLDIPTSGACGLFVDGETRLHEPDDIVVFDDSKTHGAFNDSLTDARVVLIVDLLRPPGVPPGRAKGGHTKELDSFIAKFK